MYRRVFCLVPVLSACPNEPGGATATTTDTSVSLSIDPSTNSGVSSEATDTSPEAASTGTSAGDGATTANFSTGGETGSVGADCDFYQQDCKPEFKCAPLDAPICLSDQFKCVPLSEPAVGHGELCTLSNGICGGVDNCEIGSFCSLVDGQQIFGTCLATCMGSIGEGFKCSAPTQECVRIGGDVSVCIPRCHPLKQDCDAGQTCSYQGLQFGMACIAQDPMPSGLLMPCESEKDCEVGLSCAPEGAPGCQGPCCTPFCNVQDANSCASVPDSTCIALEFSEPSPDLADLGTCR